jgi:excisionase family DNA binding protein
MEKLLAPDELAELLGYPVKTLAEWRSNGDGPPYVRLGRHVRYRPEDVETWIAAQVKTRASA